MAVDLCTHPKTPSCPFQLLLPQDLYQECSELLSEMFLMSLSIWGPLSAPLQEVLPAGNVFFGLSSALLGLEAPVRQSSTQIFSPQSQGGIRATASFRWGTAILESVLGTGVFCLDKQQGAEFPSAAGSRKGGGGVKRLLCRRLVMKAPKSGFSVGFLLHKRWTLSSADMVEVAW